jgi:hypothetical protein
MTQPKGSVSLRRIFAMTAIALFKAWIAFRAYKRITAVIIIEPYVENKVCSG